MPSKSRKKTPPKKLAKPAKSMPKRNPSPTVKTKSKTKAKKRRKATMADKKQDDEDRRRKEQQQREMEKNAPKEKQRQEQTQRDSPYREPEIGSTEPGSTTMANPARQNVPIEPPPPTDDPMSTPQAGPVPNPPSRPGGDFAGEPNVSPTGEKLSPDHPDYRKDVEGQHGPDHRTAEEKKDHPLDDKGQADNTSRSDP